MPNLKIARLQANPFSDEISEAFLDADQLVECLDISQNRRVSGILPAGLYHKEGFIIVVLDCSNNDEVILSGSSCCHCGNWLDDPCSDLIISY